MKVFGVIKVSAFQAICWGFLALSVLGTVLLMLPVSTRGPGGASFADSLFTATSAVCVTGLIVRYTAAYWSPFGQAVILLLIQVGGMGVITMAISAAYLTGRKIGLAQRSLLQESISAPRLGGVIRLTGFIIKTALITQAAGALLMAPVFCRDFGLGRGLWYALFHSVSAFCNAGFDLMGVRGEFSSLTGYIGSPLINLTAVVLITVGGLGFMTWDDIRRHGPELKKYSLQSKLVLITGGVLLFVPAVLFFFTEFASLPLKERLLASLFQSATARTAGFNTADLGAMSEGGKLLMIALMLTGGAPGSTAGGMKTTTLAVLITACAAVFRRRDSIEALGRRIPDSVLRHGAAIFLMYMALFLISGAAISAMESLPLLTALFETASAIGTVGLTLGVTPGLGLASRGILIALMFFGRVGGLTIIYSFSNPGPSAGALPPERITVG